MAKLTFRKHERLCSQVAIDRLYDEGQRLYAFPFSVHWRNADAANPLVPCRVMIVVPKRRFHHAVDRNHLRRLTRECYRQQKPLLYLFLQQQGIGIDLSLVYNHTEALTYAALNRRMASLLQKLMADMTKHRAE